jgi:HK97 family phage portal protein
MKLLPYQTEQLAAELLAMTDERHKAISDAVFSDFDGKFAGGQINTGNGVSVRAANTASKNLTPAQAFELCIAVNKAVNVIANQVSKAKAWLLDRDGNTVKSGPALDLMRMPAPRTCWREWVYELLCWYLIEGEGDAWAKVRRGEDFPHALYLLNPKYLSVDTPKQPNDREEVRWWQYTWKDGTVDYIRGDQLAYMAMFNPNHTTIRALSPLITGSISVGTDVAIGRYNKDFYDNHAIPSHILNLGEGVGRQQREDITDRYLAEFSAYRNNAHKVMVVSGKDISVERIDEGGKDGQFLGLKTLAQSEIFMLYGVPPIEAGMMNQSKYDSVAEERSQFVESTLDPIMCRVSAMMQRVLDMHFAFSPRTRGEKAKLGRKAAPAFEQMRSEHPNSEFIFMLDPDSLPIMAKVKASQVAAAKDMRDTLMLSAKEVIDYYGFDVPDRKERDDVWMLNNYLNVSHPEFMQKLQPKGQQTGEAPKANGRPTGSTKAKSLSDADKSEVKAFDKFARKLRKLTLDSLDAGELYSLDDADALDDAGRFARPIRLIHHKLKGVLDDKDPKRAAKDLFNHMDGAEILGLAHE